MRVLSDLLIGIEGQKWHKNAISSNLVEIASSMNAINVITRQNFLLVSKLTINLSIIYSLIGVFTEKSLYFTVPISSNFGFNM